MWHRTIDCLGVAVGITSRLSALAPALDAVFKTYSETASSPDLAYVLDRGDWPRLQRDGELVARYDEDVDLVAALEIDVYAQVMARAHGLVVHAGAVVGARGDVLVFAGPSGAGKSTLVRGLLAHGYRYLSEECVAFRADQRCAGLARSLHVDDPLVQVPSGFAVDAYELRRPTGLHRTRLFHPPEDRVWRGDARAVAIVVVDHAPDAREALTPLTGGELLNALWPVVFRRDSRAVSEAASGLAGVRGYALLTSTAAQALARVLELAAQHGVTP
jgi:hypothetical protein